MAGGKKNTIITYSRTCFQSFEELPFGELDAAILTWLCYLLIHEDIDNNFSDEGMPISKLLRTEYFDEMLKGLYWKKESFELMVNTAASPRYRDARIKYYRYENNEDIALQFSAMVFTFREDLHFVAYRGTDKTVNGWKEDFMLLADKAVPGQLMAVNYLNGVGAKLKGELILGGHSKGGNLAVYASAHCKKTIQKRISRVYSMDGPGFPRPEHSNPGMIAIKDRVVKYVPKASPVGLINDNEVVPIYVISNQAGALQHFPCSWEVEGNAFKRTTSHSILMQKVTANINEWAASVSDDEVQKFVAAFFDVIDKAKISDLDEVVQNRVKYTAIMIKCFALNDPKNKAYILKTLFEAFSGTTKKMTIEEQKDLKEYGIEWRKVENLMNDYEAKRFGEKYDLFL